MSVSMSAVWDRTSEFLSSRLAPVAGIAVLAIFLPTLISEIAAPYREGPVSGLTLGLGLLSIALNLAILWGQLGITVLALDAAATADQARAHATRRLPAMIGVAIVMLLALLVLIAPVFAILASNGVDLTRLDQPGAMQSLSVGASGTIALYILILAPVLLFLLSRLAMVVVPVVVAETLGLGAIGRAFRLTRGHSWKIIGVVLLYLIVMAVAMMAAMGVFGALFSFFSEPGQRFSAATVALAIISAALTAVFSVLATAFGAKLYLALRERTDAHYGEAAPAA